MYSLLHSSLPGCLKEHPCHLCTTFSAPLPQGCYCIVQYDSEAPVQKALMQRNHQLSGYPLTVRPRKPITPYRRPVDNDRNLRKVKATQEEEEQVEASHEQLMKSMLQADSVRACC